LKNNLDSNDSTERIFIKQEDFEVALTKVFPSVSIEDELSYKELEKSLKKTRAHIGK
jgi:hypothetical protein